MPKQKVGRRHGNGEGAGPGWGGPAKGPGDNSPPAPPLEHGHTLSRGYHDMSRNERLNALKEKLFDLAMSGESEQTQVRAAEALLNRIEGAPVSRNINLNVDDLSALSDDEVSAELARISGARDSAAAGDTPPDVSSQSNGMVQ